MKLAQYGLWAAFVLCGLACGTPSQAQTHGVTAYTVKQYITQTSINGGGYTITAGSVSGECSAHAYGYNSTGEASAKFATTVTWPGPGADPGAASLKIEGSQSGAYATGSSGSASTFVDWSAGHLGYSTAVNGNGYNQSTSSNANPASTGTEIYFTLDAYAHNLTSYASADANYYYTPQN